MWRPVKYRMRSRFTSRQASGPVGSSQLMTFLRYPRTAPGPLGVASDDMVVVRAEPDDSWPWQKVAGVTALAAAALPLGYALLSWFQFEDKNTAYRNRCVVPGQNASEDCLDEREDVLSYKTDITFGLVSAGALAATGTVLLFISPPAPGSAADQATVVGISGRF